MLFLVHLAYNINEMRCQNVFLGKAEQGGADLVTTSVEAPAPPPASASALPVVPAADAPASILPVVPKAEGGLPVVPSADNTALEMKQVSTSACSILSALDVDTFLLLQDTAAAGALPVVPKAGDEVKDAGVKLASSSTSSSKSSSSSYSSSWSSSSEGGEVPRENPKIDNKEEDLPVEPAAQIATTNDGSSSSILQTSHSKTTANEATEAAEEASPTSMVDFTKSSESKANAKEATAPTATPPAGDLKADDPAQSTGDPTPTLSEGTKEAAAESESPPSSSVDAPADTDSSEEDINGVKAETGDASAAEGKVTEPTSEGEEEPEKTSIADTAVNIQEETDMTSEEIEVAEGANDDPNLNNTDASISTIEGENQQEGQEYQGDDDTEASKTGSADSPSGTPAKGGSDEDHSEKVKDTEASASMGAASAAAAAAAGDGSLASWQDSLDAATGGVTQKEKVAIGTGCAAVAVFALVIIWALLNRQKVSNMFKRRSWASMSAPGDYDYHEEKGGRKTDSQASWTVSDWEKMDASPGINKTKISRIIDDHSPRMSEQSMAGVGALRDSSTAHARHPPGLHREINDIEGEELGYDWLELASEGRGLSPNNAPGQQSRFSSSPRKRSFIATSMLSSPGIVAKAFRIIVPVDTKKVPPLMKAPLGRKIFKNGNTLSPESAKSPQAAGGAYPSPDSGRQAQNGHSPARSPLPQQLSRSPGPSPPPKQYRTAANRLQQAVRNPFDDAEEAWSPAGSPPSHTMTRQTPQPFRQVIAPQVPQQSHAKASPVPDLSQTPSEIEYVSEARSSPSTPSGGFSTPSLALPGGQTPPMTPMSGRAPRISISSEPEELQAHMMHQRTMDFRVAEGLGDQEEETFPEDAEGYDLEEEEEEDGSEEEEEEEGRTSYGNATTETDPWYTRSSALPPSLLDSVPITQEEIRKSRSRNTVRFAE